MQKIEKFLLIYVHGPKCNRKWDSSLDFEDRSPYPLPLGLPQIRLFRLQKWIFATRVAENLWLPGSARNSKNVPCQKLWAFAIDKNFPRDSPASRERRSRRSPLSATLQPVATWHRNPCLSYRILSYHRMSPLSKVRFVSPAVNHRSGLVLAMNIYDLFHWNCLLVAVIYLQRFSRHYSYYLGFDSWWPSNKSFYIPSSYNLH